MDEESKNSIPTNSRSLKSVHINVYTPLAHTWLWTRPVPEGPIISVHTLTPAHPKGTGWSSITPENPVPLLHSSRLGARPRTFHLTSWPPGFKINTLKGTEPYTMGWPWAVIVLYIMLRFGLQLCQSIH